MTLIGRVVLGVLLVLMISGLGETKKPKNGKTVRSADEGKVRVVRESLLKPDQPSVEEVIATQPIYRGETVQQQAYITRHVYKPKSLKVLTTYDVCKAECRKARDQETAKEYVDRLKEELRLAEEHERLLAQQQQQAELLMQQKEQQPTEA